MGNRGGRLQGRLSNVYVTKLTPPTAADQFRFVLEETGLAARLALSRVIVCIKINLCDYRMAESGATTHPEILAGLLEAIRWASPASQISILENDGSSVEAHSLFRMLGIAAVADQFQATLLNAAEGHWVRRTVERGRILRELEVPAIIEESDLFVNLAKLKTNALTKMTGCLKNIFGLLRTKRKSVYHPVIDDVLVDVNRVIQPDLSLIDGFIGMEGLGGPAFGRPKRCELLISGVDPVAVDGRAARIMGFNPWLVRHIRLCHRAGIGSVRHRVLTGPGDVNLEGHRFRFNVMQYAIRNLLRGRVGIAG